jgi:molybdate-binding protein/DNA-binding transcriptional regulator YhcF (GntR family)
MLDINLDETAQSPLYRQIAEQIRQHIATNRLQPGEHLPTIRQLASDLQLNPNTIVRAYLELEKEGIIVSRRGAGTIVSTKSGDPKFLIQRQRRLSNVVSSNIIEALSLGYSPEELDAAFHIHLAQWKEERINKARIVNNLYRKSTSENKMHIVGSHDIALSLLLSQFKHAKPEIEIEVTYAGSLGGLIALQEDRADLAGIHLLDEETGEYNYPYVKHLLPGREMAVIHLAYRIQGLMFARNNPKQVHELGDLKRPDIIFINRQKGSGTRILLDLELRKQGIMPSEINGYENELDTHSAVAICIARNEADIGLGIQAAAQTCDLDFLPLFHERYDLVIPAANYHSERLKPLLSIVASNEFKKMVDNVGGYDTSQMGSTAFYA